MLDALTGELDAIGSAGSSGAVYDRCGRTDKSLAAALRLFEWYSSKYDQRLNGELAPTLHAADEVVRSCWSEPFILLGRPPPTGPLVYLDGQFDAFATPRVSVPPDLRAPADSLVAAFVSELPIPAIALPDFASREAWWLVLAAHETGHHVQKDLFPGRNDLLPQLEQATRDRLTEVTAAAPEGWPGWAMETFADAYSVLMVGEAAAWAIGELQHSIPANEFRLAGRGSRYPPPAVREALLGECLRAMGASSSWPTAAQAVARLDALADPAVPGAVREVLTGQLAVVPAVAHALIDLPIGSHHLRELAGVQPGLLTKPAELYGWAGQLTQPNAVLPGLAEPAAARLVTAAGVAAYRHWAGHPAAASVLPVVQQNLLALLPACGPPGVLEAPPSPAEVTALAGRLSQRLLWEAPDEADR